MLILIYYSIHTSMEKEFISNDFDNEALIGTTDNRYKINPKMVKEFPHCCIGYV